MDNFWTDFVSWLLSLLPRAAGAAVIFGVGWWLSGAVTRFVKRAMARAKTDAGISSFLISLVNASLKVIVALMALAQLGVDVSSLIAALAAAGVTAGLALKESLSNVASGAQIIFTHPFRVGDYLSIPAEGIEGTVERIEIMYTSLRTFDNKETIIPNSKVMTSVITNFTAMKTRRLDLTYTIAYDDDIAAAKAVLQRLCSEEERIEKDPAPLIAVGEYQDSAVALVVKVWCKIEVYWDVYYSMQEKVKPAFDEAGLHIPFPQLDVHLPTESPSSPAKK